jgi:hypothetical protein
MTNLLTAHASLVLQILLVIIIPLVIVLVIDIHLNFMLLYHATFYVFALFTAAPPDERLGVLVVLMHMATPIKV